MSKLDTYKVWIVDDEEHCRSALERAITQYCPHLKIIASVESVDTALPLMVTKRPQLVFLDVEMPEEDGFQLLQQLKPFNIPVIFTTAHERYALPALKQQALDYLLKPIEPRELVTAVNKLEYPEHIMDNNSKIALPTLKGLCFVSVDDIIRCEADGAYTNFILTEGTLLVSRNIGAVEALLQHHRFFRTHKSHLVNLRHVKEYIRGKGGTLIMSDHSSVEVSKRKREDFLITIST